MLLLGNTLCNEKFQALIKTFLRREIHMPKKHNFIINIDSRIANIINSSQMVAGSFVHCISIIAFKGEVIICWERNCSWKKREEKKINWRGKETNST